MSNIKLFCESRILFRILSRILLQCTVAVEHFILLLSIILSVSYLGESFVGHRPISSFPGGWTFQSSELILYSFDSLKEREHTASESINRPVKAWDHPMNCTMTLPD